MKLRYSLLLIPFIIMRLSIFPIAPIAVFFGSQKHLRWPFKWVDTIDNDLGGDEGWKTEHIVGNPYSYKNKVLWIWRNGGNWASYYTFGLPKGVSKFWYLEYKPIGNKFL